MRSTDSPEISVVMGVRDGGDRLPATIESVLAQEGVDFEFVVVDDGSADGTPAILEGYASRDPRVRVLRQAPAGLTRALIAGCAAARGELIARQDAADLSLPGRLRRQRDLLRENAALALAGCGYEVIAPRGETMSSCLGEPEARAAGRLRALETGSNLTLLHHGSVIFRKAAYEAAGGYRPQFYYAQDLDLWTRMIDQGGIAYVPELLYRISFHYGCISASRRLVQERLQSIIVEAARARRRGESEAPFLAAAAAVGQGGRAGVGRADVAYFIGSCLKRRGDARARGYFREALADNPFHLRALVRLAQSLALPGGKP